MRTILHQVLAPFEGFVGRDSLEDARAFAVALDLRLRDNAAKDLVASFRLALQRTKFPLSEPDR